MGTISQKNQVLEAAELPNQKLTAQMRAVIS